MTVRISRLDLSLPLPAYHTAGSVAFDLSPRVDVTIAPGATAMLPTNLIVEVPTGFVLLIIARSSLMKRGLVLANGVGVIDQDYCGPNDELHLALRNTTDQPIEIKRGDRLAQGLFTPVERAEWHEIAHAAITTATRGGWGSTGK
ncbi:dUTP diphosphatase [Candidatus Uhrbacteria bacterium]|nr:dUTP diphosphatase [Candidatus Uhrbacteria bacterium]